MLCLQGIIITRLARKYGYERKGRVGLGAITMLSLVVISWVVVGVIFAARHLAI
jgi:hypothetical protein